MVEPTKTLKEPLCCPRVHLCVEMGYLIWSKDLIYIKAAVLPNVACAALDHFFLYITVKKTWKTNARIQCIPVTHAACRPACRLSASNSINDWRKDKVSTNPKIKFKLHLLQNKHHIHWFDGVSLKLAVSNLCRVALDSSDWFILVMI